VDCLAKKIYWNGPDWNKDFRGPLEIVDGKQRINAVIEFLHNKIKAFGYTLSELGGREALHFTHEFIFHIGNLESRKEILQWYIDMNIGGSIHTDEEIKKVKKLLSKEK